MAEKADSQKLAGSMCSVGHNRKLSVALRNQLFHPSFFKAEKASSIGLEKRAVGRQEKNCHVRAVGEDFFKGGLVVA